MILVANFFLRLKKQSVRRDIFLPSIKRVDGRLKIDYGGYEGLDVETAVSIE